MDGQTKLCEDLMIELIENTDLFTVSPHLLHWFVTIFNDDDLHC